MERRATPLVAPQVWETRLAPHSVAKRVSSRLTVEFVSLVVTRGFAKLYIREKSPLHGSPIMQRKSVADGFQL
jgi:hypothetical protein